MMDTDKLFNIAPDLEKILSNSPYSIPGLGITNGLQQNMLFSSATKLAETNKNIPNVDPFAVPQTSTNSIFDQIKNKLFALGGVANNNVEIEGGETIETPNGEIIKMKGKSHEQGGMDMNLPENTKVYSKRIIIDKKSMSDRKIEREKRLEKQKIEYSKDKSDIINKNGYERIKAVNQMQEYYDMQFQKILNDSMSQPEQNNNSMVQGKQKFAYGTDGQGIPGEEIPPGGLSKNFLWTNSDHLTAAYDLFDNNPDLFDNFTDWYKQSMKKDYPETYENFMEKVKEAGTNLNDDGTVKTNIYSTTYTDPDVKQNEISTIPNLGTFFNSNNGTRIWGKYINGTNPEDIPSKRPLIGPDSSLLPGVTPTPGTTPTPGATPKPTPKPTPGQTYKEDAKDYIGTLGDLVGFGSTVLGSVGPASLTLANRMGDNPNYSFFKQYGERALDSNQEATKMANSVANEYLRDVDLYNNTAMDRNRASARTVNVQRSLDTVSHMESLKARENIGKSLIGSLSQLESRKGQLQSQQDQVRMGAEAQADLSNRQDRDAFFTNFNQDLNTASTYGQKMGADLNKTIQNRMFLSMLPELTQNGIGLQLSDIMGNIQMYDNNGDTKLLGNG